MADIVLLGTSVKDGGSSLSRAGTKRPKSPSSDEPGEKMQRSDSVHTLNSENSDGKSTSRNPNVQTSIKIPPIYLDSMRGWAQHALSMTQLTKGHFKATCNGKQYKIMTDDVVHFRAIQRYLADNKLPYHTFTLASKRTAKVVIAGLANDIEGEEVQDALLDLKFAVTEVTKLKTPRGVTNLWVATFLNDSEKDSQSRPAREIFNITTLLYVRVNIRPYRKPSGPNQCHRCQGFGHGSSNCGRPAKCVRCGGPHSPQHCSRPAGERGTCCNCGGSHNANYRGCPAYKQQKSRGTPPGRPTTGDRPLEDRRVRGDVTARTQLAESGSRPRGTTAATEGPSNTSTQRSFNTDNQPEQDLVDDCMETGGDDQPTYADAARRRRRAPRNPANRKLPGQERGNLRTLADPPTEPATDTRPAVVVSPRASQPHRGPTAPAPRPADACAGERSPPPEVTVVLDKVLLQLSIVTELLTTLAALLRQQHGQAC